MKHWSSLKRTNTIIVILSKLICVRPQLHRPTCFQVCTYLSMSADRWRWSESITSVYRILRPHLHEFDLLICIVGRCRYKCLHGGTIYENGLLVKSTWISVRGLYTKTRALRHLNRSHCSSCSSRSEVRSIRDIGLKDWERALIKHSWRI